MAVNTNTFLEKITNECHENYTGLQTKTTKSLLTRYNEIVFYWSEVQKCIYTSHFHLNEKRLEDLKSCQTIRTSISPLFEVSSIKCNKSGKQLLVYGKHGIGVVLLPRQWGEQGNYEDGKPTMHCKMKIIDEAFYAHHSSVEILKVGWYSGSDSYIVVLSSDNNMRFYDIAYPDQPMLRLPLFNRVSRGESSVLSFSAICGDNAVDFDLGGTPTTDAHGNTTHSIYVMQESGDVWVLYCKFQHNRLQVQQCGPLIMNPPADDNYGCNYTSIECLPTTPTPVIAMATQRGTVHHCIVLQNDLDKSVDLNTSNDTTSHEEALYVYESVQISPNLLHDEVEYEEDVTEKNIQIQKDPDNEKSYIAVSNGGVHHISLPWIGHLHHVLSNDEQEVEIEDPAEINYLLCTQPSKDSPSSAVYGCLFHQNILACVLSSGEVLDLSLKRSNEVTNSPEAIKKDATYHSPLRQLRGTGSFDRYIAKLLQRQANVPVIRSGGGQQTVPAEEYYRLLTTTTQILREEYIQKMLHAKMELQKRCKLLETKKKEQANELEYLKENLGLSADSEKLAVKLETAQESMYTIVERLGKVLRGIRSSSSVLSTEEKEWNTELKQTNDNLTKLRRMVEVVKTKQQNMQLQVIPRTKKQPTTGKNTSLAQSNVVKIRGVLKEQEESINTLIDATKSLSMKFAN